MTTSVVPGESVPGEPEEWLRVDHPPLPARAEDRLILKAEAALEKAAIAAENGHYKTSNQWLAVSAEYTNLIGRLPSSW